MKLILLLFILLLSYSCSVSKSNKAIPEYVRATLVSKPIRTMYGYKLTLVTSGNDTLKRYEQKYCNWIVGECYLVIK